MIYYSIIIPHKNTPDLLQYCLDSIPVRDDIQVIVVDDNSNADKVDFEHFPQWKGEYYEYYLTKEGKGAGYARNAGLEHARGKWILFVDADDFLLPSVGEIFEEEKNTNADIVFFRPKAVMLDDRESSSNRSNKPLGIIEDYYRTGDETGLRCRWFSPCNRFFRLEMIRDNNIRFDEIQYSNDNLFAVKTGICAGKVVVRNKSYYCVTESDNQLTSNFLKKPCEIQIRVDAFFRAQMVVHDHGYPVDEKIAIDYLQRLFSDDREAFCLNFNRMRRMGYKKLWLIHELFKGNSKKARFKRSVYCFVMTGV